jgi:hypothetical protein
MQDLGDHRLGVGWAEGAGLVLMLFQTPVGRLAMSLIISGGTRYTRSPATAWAAWWTFCWG